MEDGKDSSFDVRSERSAKFWREVVDTRVDEPQREAVDRLTVGSLEEKVGFELSDAILTGRGRVEPSKWDSFTREIVQVLSDHNPGSEVYAADILGISGEKKRFFVSVTESDSKNPGEKYKFIEVFEKPKVNEYFPHFVSYHDRIQYRHDLVLNTDTGLTADLIDIVPKNTPVYLDFEAKPSTAYFKSIYMRRDFEDVGGLSSEIVFSGKDSSVAIIHEAGHVYQHQAFFDKPQGKLRLKNLIDRLGHRLKLYTTVREVVVGKGKISKAAKDWGRSVVKERNAWAFSLAVVRKYRQLGVDIMPGMGKREIVSTINNYNLTSYDNIRPGSKVRFNKARKGVKLEGHN